MAELRTTIIEGGHHIGSQPIEMAARLFGQPSLKDVALCQHRLTRITQGKIRNSLAALRLIQLSGCGRQKNGLGSRSSELAILLSICPSNIVSPTPSINSFANSSSSSQTIRIVSRRFRFCLQLPSGDRPLSTATISGN